jgi:hypothetical protein
MQTLLDKDKDVNPKSQSRRYYPDPCQNNGTCDGVSGNATYVCPPEYKGRHMQVIYLMTVMRKHLSRNREVPVLIVTLD